jgi:hypothetical protein
MKEDLDKVFDTLKKIMKNYSPPFSVQKPSEALKKKRSYGLVSKKKVMIAGRERDEVYFAGIIKQKDYVGFYYMIAYAEPEVAKMLSPEFLALLKGKTCFYIRSTDKFILSQVRKALDIALRIYKKKNWV